MSAPPAIENKFVRQAVQCLLHCPIFARERVADLILQITSDFVDPESSRRAADLLESEGIRVIQPKGACYSDARLLVFARPRHSIERLMAGYCDNRSGGWASVLLEVPGAREGKQRFSWYAQPVAVVSLPWPAVAPLLDGPLADAALPLRLIHSVHG